MLFGKSCSHGFPYPTAIAEAVVLNWIEIAKWSSRTGGIKTNSSARFSQIRSFFYRKIKTATKDSLLLADRWLGPRPMGNELMEIGSFSGGVAAPYSCFFFRVTCETFQTIRSAAAAEHFSCLFRGLSFWDRRG